MGFRFLADVIQVVSLVGFCHLGKCGTVGLGRDSRRFGLVIGLPFDNFADEGERQLPAAGQNKQDRYQFDCSFTLHSYSNKNYIIQ